MGFYGKNVKEKERTESNSNGGGGQENKRKHGRETDYCFIEGCLALLNDEKREFRNTKKMPQDIYMVSPDAVLSKREFLLKGTKFIDLMNKLASDGTVRFQMVNLENGWNMIVEPGDAIITKACPDVRAEEIKMFARKAIRVSGQDMDSLTNSPVVMKTFMERLAIWIEKPDFAVSKGDFRTREKHCLSISDLMRPVMEAKKYLEPSTEDPVLPEGSVFVPEQAPSKQRGFLGFGGR